MKHTLLAFSAMLVAASFSSCDKSSEADVDLLAAELEAKNTGKRALSLGMEYQGGIIFYLDESGRHGLIAAKEDLGPAPWGCFGTEITGARTNDGLINTRAILATCSEPGIAARLCDQYEVREKDKAGRKYRDWYMPSGGEFSQLVQVLKSSSGFCGRTYWCSTEEPAGFMAMPVNLAEKVYEHNVACAVDPDEYGFFRMPVAKTAMRYVRPIRAF